MVIKDINAYSHKSGLIKLEIICKGDVDALKASLDEINLAGEDRYAVRFVRTYPKRSIDANSYYWVLITKLAQKLRMSAEEAHRQILHYYGVVKTDERGLPVTFDLDAGEDPAGVAPYFRFVEIFEEDGRMRVRYAEEKGSSEMDSSEFSALLDGLISECREQGIDVQAWDEEKK